MKIINKPYCALLSVQNKVTLFFMLCIFHTVFLFAEGKNTGKSNPAEGIHEIDKRTIFSIGAYFNTNYVRYEGHPGILDGDINSLDFKNGSGLNYSGGIIAQISFSSSVFYQLRAGLSNNSGIMKCDYYLPIIEDRYVKTEHELKMELMYLSIDLLCKINLYDNFFCIGGASYGIPLKTSYRHSIILLSDEIAYNDNSSVRTMNKVQIENPEKPLSARAGLGYTLSVIENSLYIIPEIDIDYPLSKTIRNSDFKRFSFNGLLSIVFDL